MNIGYLNGRGSTTRLRQTREVNSARFGATMIRVPLRATTGASAR